MVNQWKDMVSDELVGMFENWVEYYISRFMSYRSLPVQCERRVFHLSYNKLGHRQYDIEVLSGKEESYATTPHQYNRMDEFTQAYRDLSHIEQLAVIGYFDPFDELQDPESWRKLLNQCKCINNGDYNRLLRKAMINLQNFAERRGLISKKEVRNAI